MTFAFFVIMYIVSYQRNKKESVKFEVSKLVDCVEVQAFSNVAYREFQISMIHLQTLTSPSGSLKEVEN